ncbi:MAG: hypothetical protein ACR2NN_13920 [Bryobacteraceae bacterium]
MEFLKELGRQLGASLPKEILPASVLVRSVDMLVWWTPRQMRLMFYGDASDGRALNGKAFPVPPLVFKVSGSELSVRALASAERPSANTKLMIAPFWNTDSRGTVCQGSMRAPARLTLDAISQWEGLFSKASSRTQVSERSSRNTRKDFWGCGASLRARGVSLQISRRQRRDGSGVHRFREELNAYNLPQSAQTARSNRCSGLWGNGQHDCQRTSVPPSVHAGHGAPWRPGCNAY